MPTSFLVIVSSSFRGRRSLRPRGCKTTTPGWSERCEDAPGAKLASMDRFPLVSRVDAALSKLIWVREGSHRSRRDLRRIREGASEQERAAMGTRSEGLGLDALLSEVLNEADEIDR